MHPILKLMITVFLVMGISELAKRSTMLGAVLASIPLISVLSLIWLYVGTKDLQAVSQLSLSVFWLVIPSLILFVSLPVLIKFGWSFPLSLLISCVLTVLGYFGMLKVLAFFGVSL